MYPSKVSDSVYFDVSKAATYGRLARLDTAGLLDGGGEGGGFADGEQFAAEKRGKPYIYGVSAPPV